MNEDDVRIHAALITVSTPYLGDVRYSSFAFRYVDEDGDSWEKSEYNLPIPVFPRRPCPPGCWCKADDSVETPLHPSAYDYAVQVAWRREQMLTEEIRLSRERGRWIW